jgi:hypothetical protein
VAGKDNAGIPVATDYLPIIWMQIGTELVVFHANVAALHDDGAWWHDGTASERSE